MEIWAGEPRQFRKNVTGDSERQNYLSFSEAVSSHRKGANEKPLGGQSKGQSHSFMSHHTVMFCTAGQWHLIVLLDRCLKWKMFILLFTTHAEGVGRGFRRKYRHQNKSAQDQHKMKPSSSSLPLNTLNCFGRFQPSSNIKQPWNFKVLNLNPL